MKHKKIIKKLKEFKAKYLSSNSKSFDYKLGMLDSIYYALTLLNYEKKKDNKKAKKEH